MRGLASAIASLNKVPEAAAREAAPKLTLLLQEQFDRGLDPYGRPWQPLAPRTLARGRRPPPLTDTGRLRGGTGAVARGGGQPGIQLVAGAEYGKFAQFGFRVRGKAVPAREIFPTLGLPLAWALVIKNVMRRAVRATLKRG